MYIIHIHYFIQMQICNLFVAWLVWRSAQMWHQVGFEVADSGLEMAAVPLVSPHCRLSQRLAPYFPYLKAVAGI